MFEDKVVVVSKARCVIRFDVKIPKDTENGFCNYYRFSFLNIPFPFLVQKDPKPPFTPPSNFSSGIVTSANRRVSTRKRRSGILALTPTSSVKRRRITNEGRGNTPVSTTPRSAKRRRSRAKNQINGTPLINFDDPEDPYNFFFKSNEHPTPLKDISVYFYNYFFP